jgi:hypothetical protein
MQTRVVVAEQLRHPTTYVDGAQGHEMAKIHRHAAQPVDCPFDSR